MRFSSLVNKEYIVTGDRFQTVMEAVEHLVGLFVKKERLPETPERILEIIKDREKLGGTVLPPGVAIPHGRLEGFEDVLIGMWIPETPLQTEQDSVKVLFCFLTSKSGSALYLPVLSSVGMHFNNSEFLDSLMGMSVDSVFEHLQTIQVKKDVTVADIMTTDVPVCRKEMSLAQLADLFYEKKVSYLPVVNEKSEQIGEVTISDLLSRGVPDYVKRLGDISFMRALEPFEALLREEDDILVEEIMRAPSRKIEAHASIIEAVLMFTTRQIRHIPVVEGKHVIGMLSTFTILEKVLRA